MTAQSAVHIPIVSFPPTKLRRALPSAEWTSLLESWSVLCNYFLRLSDGDATFQANTTSGSSLVKFILSYLEGISTAQADEAWLSNRHAQTLHFTVYRIFTRIVAKTALPEDINSWRVFARFCIAYRSANGLSQLIEDAWQRHHSALEPSLLKYRYLMVAQLSKAPLLEQVSVQEVLPLLWHCPSAGCFMLTGTDLFDAVVEEYPKLSPTGRRELLLLAYMMLQSPLLQAHGNVSLFSDNLYSLKGNADSSLLSDLVTSTPFLARSRRLLVGRANKERLPALLADLDRLKRASSNRPRERRARPNPAKGKRRATEDQEAHYHQMASINQIQDLFPNLGSAYVAKLLDAFKDNVETVVARLLEENLPPELANMDQTAQLPLTAHETTDEYELGPRSTPPPVLPQRRNIHDDDEFDRLSVSASRIHFGRKEAKQDVFQQDAEVNKSAKAAILSALAAFEADDDERDDTYDLEDVGGTVDTSVDYDNDESQRDLTDEMELKLFAAWTTDAQIFGRDSATRRSKPRAALKAMTGLTDEAIEGWAIMMQRNPKSMKRLANKSTDQHVGQQAGLQRTAWRAEDAGDSDNGGPSSGPEAVNSRRGGRGRGMGRTTGARGGARVANPAEGKDTQASRQHKEANKSSRANHNRRDQRARKMARGGFPG